MSNTRPVGHTAVVDPDRRMRFFRRDQKPSTKEERIAGLTAVADGLLGVVVRGTHRKETLPSSRRIILSERAISVCDQAIALSGEGGSFDLARLRARSFLQLGMARHESELYTGAEAALKEALEFYLSKFPGLECGITYYYLGLTRDHLNQKEEASNSLILADSQLERAKLGPNMLYAKNVHVEVLLKLAEISFEAGQLEQALAAFVRLIILSREDAIPHLALCLRIQSAIRLRDGGELAITKIWFQVIQASGADNLDQFIRVFSLDDHEGSPPEKREMAILLLGHCWMEKGNYELAIQYFERGRKLYRDRGKNRDWFFDEHIQAARQRMLQDPTVEA